MILIILAASVLTILIEMSVALPTDIAIASKISDKVAVDKFGVTEIYPTKPDGGREWHINMNSPLNDNSFFLSGGTEKTNTTFATLLHQTVK